MKKLFAMLLTGMLLMFAACTPAVNPSAQPSQSATPEATATPEPELAWEGKYLTFNGSRVEITVEGGEKDEAAKPVTITVDNEATVAITAPDDGSFNCYKLSYTSTQPLWMYVSYGETEELCFLEATESAALFTSNVDGFIENASGKGLKSLRFKNCGTEPAVITVNALDTATRDVPEQVVYLSNDYIKIGSDLLSGGALSFCEYIKEPVQMVTMNGRAEVGINYADKVDAADVLDTEVNLFNNYDTGRLVQQSYYGTNSAPYVPSKWGNAMWCYNPVMGGDCGNYHSKIVDFEITENHIYVKCRPMDWSKNNEPTFSYMESVYTIDGRNLIVKNRFVDFSGYKHGNANQELPAFYVIEPLYRLAYYAGNDLWSDGELTFRDDLPFWDGIWEKFRNRECWWAWVNGDTDGFGLGLYVPDVNTVTGGIFSHNKNVGDDASKAGPTSYIAALRQMTLLNYVPLEYSYMVSCGKLSEIRQSFKEADAAQVIDNDTLKKYGKK